MTLPSTTILPIHSEKIAEGGEALNSYMQELIVTLQKQYEDVAQAVNGNLKNNAGQDNNSWIPVISDSVDDTTTFTYNHQIGWVQRRGILVDLWFDISIASLISGTTTGSIEINLPYKVAVSNQKPFVGICQPSGFTFTAGTECVINARPNSYILDVFNTSDGFTTANQDSVAAGQIIGNIRYVGQGLERS